MAARDPLTALDRSFRQAHALSRRILRREFGRQDPALAQMMDYILRRQVASEYPFVFLCGFCRRESDAQRVQRLAAAVHLLQSSTFVTDDVFDHARRRYGQPSAHVRYGVSQAVLAGILMQAVALKVVGEELERGGFRNRVAALNLFNRIVLDLYRGQYADLHHTGNLRMPRREYERIIALGGGLHFAYLAKCGALLAGKSARQAALLERFGYHYGMALFLTDDAIDALQPDPEVGKDFATDLKNRRVRLPLMLALKLADRRDAAFLKSLYGKKRSDARALRRAAAIVRRSGALQVCAREAEQHLSLALGALAKLPPSRPVARLRWLAETLLETQELTGM